MAEYERITQPFPPIFNKDSRILILGSLPSAKSRENGFYYGHPRNRFWRVLSTLYGFELPETTEQKTDMLYRCGIALWDVIESCDIKGAADSTIKNAVVADFTVILNHCRIEQVFANGKTAAKLYNKYSQVRIEKPVTELPSTSPANAAYDMSRLLEAWQVIK